MTDEYDDELMQAARRLPRGVAPERDLWPEIATAIAPPETRRWAPLFAQAAAVVLLVGTSSAVTYVAMQEQQAPVVVASTELVFERAAFSSRYNLGPGFEAARNALAAELEFELEKLPAAARADVKANLLLIHAAIVETNAALEDEPDNTVLQGHLLRAYRNELMLLRRIGGLSRNVMMRNDI